MKSIIAIVIVLVIIYIVNAVKLLSCDFASPYRCEAIHAVGTFIPPASIVTVWFEDDGV